MVCFFGYRIFRLLLPFLGFFVGLIVGAQVVASIFGEGFLATIIGVVAGLVVGLLFGALAYVWWWLGVILVFGGMGYSLGAAIFPAIGIDVGIFNFVLGLVSAAVFAIIAIVLRMPKLIVVAVTGLWGSGAIIAGWLIFTNQLEPDQLGFGAVDAVVSRVGLLVDRLLRGRRGRHGLPAGDDAGVRGDVGRGVSVGEPREPNHPERAQHALSLRVCPA